MLRPHRLLPLSVSGVFALTLGLAWACSSEPSGQGNGCQSTGAHVTINARDNLTFDPPTPTVTLGQRVCWQNFGAMAHTITAEFNASDTTWRLDEHLDPQFVVAKNFSTVGDYTYHCTFHAGSNMRGTIRVR